MKIVIFLQITIKLVLLTFRVRFIHPHPNFKRHGYFNDIALIKLSRSAEFTPYILPVCLPPLSVELSPLDSLVGQTPSVIGYGSTHYGNIFKTFHFLYTFVCVKYSGEFGLCMTKCGVTRQQIRKARCYSGLLFVFY